jgi:methylated-DNA-protein-cysteine methyltransferase-like protein
MNSQFRDAVHALVAQIPPGKVMSYGQIAALCGHPGAARAVGQIAHFGPSDLPWQRVVNASGGMARGFWPDGPDGQARMLESEGTELRNNKVTMKESVWWPKN